MSERLALIVGAGGLVPPLVRAAAARGPIKVLSLNPRRDLAEYEPVPFSLSRPEEAVAVIRSFGATHFVMAGGVSLSDIARESLAGFFSGTSVATSIGDTSLSDLVARLENMTGAAPMGVHEIAPDLLAPEGRIGGPELGPVQLDSARHALRLARDVGALDLGQAVVVAGRRTVAVEDIAGTDSLIRRVRWLRFRRLVADGNSPLVLAKCRKPQQPMFLDLPAIGPRTVENAARARIGTIAVEAGATLIIERDKVAAAADRLGISVLGMRHD